MTTATQSPSNTLSLQILPPEIISIIFDFLAADRDWASLSACALLSRQYLQRARSLLFACITLKLRNSPDPVLIHDVVRRIHGLCDMFRRDSDSIRFVKRFVVLDSYPVYDSQWITQQPSLPRLINSLTGVQQCTFGCEVGYLQWGLFSTELAMSLEKFFGRQALTSLTLSNIGGIPVNVLCNSVQYLHLNNITIVPSPLTNSTRSRLCYLNLRTLSLENTRSAWELIKAHSLNLKLIRWRCWEDPQARDGVSFPGPVNLGLLPSLKKLSIRMSYGKVGRDLAGFCNMLESITRRSELVSLELFILFPHQNFPSTMPEIYSHAIWTRLAVALLRIEYCSLRRVTMELTVQDKVRMWNGRRENSVTEFRKQMKQSLRPLSNISSFHFKFKVRPFHQ